MSPSAQYPPESSSYWYSWFNRSLIIRSLEITQDVIVLGLCLGLFGLMISQLSTMFLSLIASDGFPKVTSEILSILILVELFRLLILYLQEHKISISVAVEVAIVSVLREIIIRGVLEAELSQIVGASIFLGVLALILTIRCSWIPSFVLKDTV